MSDLTYSVVITNEAISYIREINNNSLLKYVPTSFGISEAKGELNANRTYSSVFPMWILSPYTFAEPVGTDKIHHHISIPSNAARTEKVIGEIYFLAERADGTPFLFAIAQPNTPFSWKRNSIYNLNFIFRLKNTNVQDVCEFVYNPDADVTVHNNSILPHENILGRIEDLKTLNKESFVDAINELFDKIDSGDAGDLTYSLLNTDTAPVVFGSQYMYTVVDDI